MLVSNGLAYPLMAMGERTPMASTSYWYSHDGLPLVDRWALYSEIYRTQPIASAIIEKKAKLTARLTPMKVRDFTDPKRPVDDAVSDYAKLIANPCVFMDPFTFWSWVSQTWQIYGEVFILKVRNQQGKVTSLAPMHPTRTWIKRTNSGPDSQGEWIEGRLWPPGEEIFTFTLGVAAAGLLTVPRSEVIVRRNYNPDTLMRGLSPFESLTRTIQNEDSIRTANSSTWRRGAMPTMVLTSPGNAALGQATKLRDKIEQAHAGPSKAGGIFIAPQGWDVQPFQIDPQKMQLIESLQLTREEMCIRLDFPPPALHILDHATFSNITEQLRSVYRDVMIPDFEALESMLDYDLRPEFYAQPNHRAYFDLNEVLRGDFESRVSSYVSLVGNGGISPDEGRVELLGLPALGTPEAQKLYANQAMQPLGTPTAAAAAVSSGGNDAGPKAPTLISSTTPEKATAETAQVRSIMGKVGRAIKSNNLQAIRATLAEEHKTLLNGALDKQRADVKMLLKANKSIGTDIAKVLSLSQPALVDAFKPAMTATAKAGGSAVAKKLGGKYDVASMHNYIGAVAVTFAQNMNKANANELQQHYDQMSDSDSDDTDDMVDNFYDTNASSRSDLFIATLLTLFLNKAGHEAAQYNGAKTKTWNFSPGAKAERSDHAAMDGETVPINDPFSNGEQIAGDPAGSAADNAGCCCINSFD